MAWTVKYCHPLGACLRASRFFTNSRRTNTSRFHGLVVGDQGLPFGFLFLGHRAGLRLAAAVVAFVARGEAEFFAIH
jgi:hypothetical protein